MRALARLASWLMVLALTLVVASCTSKPAPKGAPPSSPPLRAPSASSSPDPRADVQAALAAYTNLLNAFVAASNAGTDDKTELAKYATGSALDLLASGLADNKAKGLHTQGTPGIDPPKVTNFGPASNPTSVSVTGCVDGTNWLLYKSNGQLADSGPNGRRRTGAQIDKTAGAWKVSSLAIQGVGTCPG
jgi:hypothetical protein